MNRILIAEDEAEIRFILSRTLEGQFSCTMAHDGLAAIEMVRADPPDAVITDLKMPGAGGLDVLAAVKQRDPLIPVVIITGYATLDTAVEALRLGAYDYIQKPFEDVHGVRTTLEHALESRNLRRENLRILEDLRRANAFKSQLLRTVAHDFKNMLQGIQGFTDLARSSDDIVEVHQELDDIQSVAQTMEALAQDLTTYGEVDSRALKLFPEDVPLGDCARRAASTLYFDRDRHRVEIPDDLPAVHADPHRTTQVLTNLLGNAVKYSPRGGTVRVRAEHNGHLVKVSVQDEGMGIPGTAMQRLFTPFFRAERDARSDIPGTGLGLTIVKSLVEGQGGEVWVESEEGTGTTFHFTLPAGQEA